MLAAHMATMDSPTPSTVNRTTGSKRVKYNDFQIWRITPSTLAHLEFLKEYKESDEHENVLWLKGPAMRLLPIFDFLDPIFQFNFVVEIFRRFSLNFW